MMGQVALDVEMPEAGDHVLASYHSEQECPIVIREQVESLVCPAPSVLRFADLCLVEVVDCYEGVIQQLVADAGLVQRSPQPVVPVEVEL